jgi:hypothetical protein
MQVDGWWYSLQWEFRTSQISFPFILLLPYSCSFSCSQHSNEPMFLLQKRHTEQYSTWRNTFQMPATGRFRHPYCAHKRTEENGFRTEPAKPTFPPNMFINQQIYHFYDFYYYIFSCHGVFPGTSLETTAISTAQASSFRLQHLPYCVWCSDCSTYRTVCDVQSTAVVLGDYHNCHHNHHHEFKGCFKFCITLKFRTAAIFVIFS